MPGHSSGRFDWEALELEYVTGGDDLSVRELARRHDASFSHFAVQARNRGWEQKRRDYRARSLVVAEDEIMNKMAVRVAQVKSDALDVIHAAILKMGVDLHDRKLEDGTIIPAIQVLPGDMAKLLDRLMPLIGQPNNISENRNLGIDLTADLPPDAARLIEELARERGTQPEPVGRRSLPGSQATGPN